MVLPFRGPLQRGDVITFRYPHDESKILFKRVIGIAGDKISYIDKRLTVNGKKLPTIEIHQDGWDKTTKTHYGLIRYGESIDQTHYSILLNPNQGSSNVSGIIVPPDRYFVMGDNRDDSLDSRYWNFLPHQNLVGKPLFIFWSFQDSPNSHLKTSFLEILKLYTKRIILFPTHTRWKRMGLFLK